MTHNLCSQPPFTRGKKTATYAVRQHKSEHNTAYNMRALTLHTLSTLWLMVFDSSWRNATLNFVRCAPLPSMAFWRRQADHSSSFLKWGRPRGATNVSRCRRQRRRRRRRHRRRKANVSLLFCFPIVQPCFAQTAAWMNKKKLARVCDGEPALRSVFCSSVRSRLCDTREV